MDDREIIRRCRCGQPAMLDLLISRYQVPLYSLCRRLPREALRAAARRDLHGLLARCRARPMGDHQRPVGAPAVLEERGRGLEDLRLPAQGLGAN